MQYFIDSMSYALEDKVLLSIKVVLMEIRAGKYQDLAVGRGPHFMLFSARIIQVSLAVQRDTDLIGRNPVQSFLLNQNVYNCVFRHTHI